MTFFCAAISIVLISILDTLECQVTNDTSVCHNKIDNCAYYDRTICTEDTYQPWAQANCALYCGFCAPPNPVPCEDSLPNCHEFDDGNLCSDPKVHGWAYEHCKHYCRFVHCHVDSCTDEIENCPQLEQLVSICNDTEHARKACQNFCGLCDIADGRWSAWTHWSNCDVTCGNGQNVRNRTCVPPQSGGLPCSGPEEESKNCTMSSCPVDGDWTSWGPWGTCSVSCGYGLQSRERNCSDPIPAYEGNHCFGTGSEYQVCTQNSCSDRGWASWDAWGECSDNGYRTRHRTCTELLYYFLDWTCKGPSVETQVCNIFLRDHQARCNGSCTLPVDNVRLCDGHITTHPCVPSRPTYSCHESRGRVEVFRNDTWGSVCGGTWSISAARVVCRMLGFGNAIATTNHYNSGTGPVFLTNVTCNGTETSLDACPSEYLDIGFDNCTDTTGAVVYCS